MAKFYPKYLKISHFYHVLLKVKRYTKKLKYFFYTWEFKVNVKEGTPLEGTALGLDTSTYYILN